MTFRTVARRGFLTFPEKTWTQEIVNLVPSGSIVWRFDNTSTITNLAGNSALNGTVNGSPSLVDSPFGPNQGLALDANGKKVIVTTNASLTTLANSTSHTIIARLRLAASPGNTSRQILNYANASSFFVSITPLDKLNVIRGADTTAGAALSTDSVIEGSNNWIAVVFNPADKPNAFRLYQGATSLSEMALAIDTAAVGALTNFAGQQLNVGDRSLNDINVRAEMFDLFIYTPSGMTQNELNAIIDVTPN